MCVATIQWETFGKLKVCGKFRKRLVDRFSQKVMIISEIWMVSVLQITDDSSNSPNLSLPNFPAIQYAHNYVNMYVCIHVYIKFAARKGCVKKILK